MVLVCGEEGVLRAEQRGRRPSPKSDEEAEGLQGSEG